MASAAERVFLPLPALDARTGVTVAPFQFALDGNDVLRIKSATSLGGARLQVQGRRRDAKGEIHPFAFEHDTSLVSDRQIVTSIHALGEGALLNVTAFVTGAQPVIGEFFVIVQIVRGIDGPLTLLGTVLQGYVTSTQGLGWPGSPILSSMDPAAGAVKTFSGTNPAAGANVSETVPPGALWELIALQVDFVASAAAAARTVFLQLRSSFAPLVAIASPVVMAASDAATLQWAQGFPFVTAVSALVPLAGLPSRVRLRGGFEIRTSVFGMQAGDDFGSPFLTVREWLEVP